MKIRIDEAGHLQIARKGNFKNVNCPYRKDVFCGDWCAFFGEPDGNVIRFCFLTLTSDDPIEDVRWE